MGPATPTLPTAPLSECMCSCGVDSLRASSKKIKIHWNDFFKCLPAAKTKSVPFAGEPPPCFIHPFEGDQTSPVVELDLVENGATVPGLGDVCDVVKELGQARE